MSQKRPAAGGEARERASFLDEKQEIKNFGTDSKKDVDKQRKKIYNQDIKEMEPIPKKENTSGGKLQERRRT